MTTHHDCRQCWIDWIDAQDPEDYTISIQPWMFLCPECGNKRCPKSTDHTFACTGSNEPGQVGSFYGVWSAKKDDDDDQEEEAVG